MKHWIVCRHATGALAALVGFLAMGAAAETTNTLSDAEIQGRQLARQLCESAPKENFTNSGAHQISDGNSRNELPLKYETIITPTNWYVLYTVGISVIKISHNGYNQNKYEFQTGTGKTLNLCGNDLMTPFAGSDFWIADLGLEFFHWPQQKVLKKEFHRQCACTVLESTNPNPTTNGYSRVVSWIDEDSLGIVEAFAYDVNGKKLKNFYPKSFEKDKASGQYQVQSMIMENLQTGSRTRLEFDLKKP